MEGYIILHKKLLEWQYYKNTNMVRLLLHLLLIADEEGKIVTTQTQLATDTGLSIKVVRSCIDKLESGRLMGRLRAGNNLVLTICEYDNYRTTKKPKWQTLGRPTGRPKTDDFDTRKQAFTEQLRPYVQVYGRDMVNDFWKYWTEPNKSRTKMRFELQATWDTNLRLETWANNELKRNGNNRTTTETKEQRAAKYAARINRLLAEDEEKFTDEEEEAE